MELRRVHSSVLENRRNDQINLVAPLRLNRAKGRGIFCDGRGHFAALPLVRSIALQFARHSLATATRLIRYTHSANLIAYGDRRISLGGYHVVGGLDDHCDVLSARTAPRRLAANDGRGYCCCDCHDTGASMGSDPNAANLSPKEHFRWSVMEYEHS